MNARNPTDESLPKEKAKTRPKRTPLHNRDILGVANKLPSKVYRWVNDVEDRLYRFTQAGWEFVTDKGLFVGEPTVNASKELGALIVKRVGGDRESYLMCIEKEFYDEDQATKARKVDESEQAMYDQLNSSRDGHYGKVEVTRD